MSTSKETYLLFGPHWRFPVEVEWDDSGSVAGVRLHPGIPWLKCWVAAARSVLTKLSFSDVDDVHYLTVSALDAVAARREVEDLETLVRWSPPEATFSLPTEGGEYEGSQRRVDRANDVRKFLLEFVDAVGPTAFGTFEELERWYYIFCNFAMMKLINGGVLDLVFAQIFSTSLGETSRFYVQYPRAGKKSGKGKKGPVTREMMLSRLRNLVRRMCDPESGTEFLRLEINEDRVWTDSVRATESRRLAENGESRYLKFIDARFKKKLDLLYENIRPTIGKTKLVQMPVCFPYVYECLGTGPEWWLESHHGSYIESLRKRKRHAERSATWWAEEEYRARMAKPDETVPQMCNLQPTSGNMRDGAGTLEEPGDWEI